MVAITGQVGASMIGTDAFQEADIRGITMPITKHNFLVTDPADIPRTVAEAFYIASTGRPGPVLVDVAKSALQAQTTFDWPTELHLPGYRPVTKPHAKQIREAARLILEARRPVLYVGGGTIRARASRELRELAEFTGMPVVTTLMARGAFPDSHPQHLGMPGMHGTVAAVAGLQRSDLIISLGARFDDRVTGNLDSFAPGAKVIHADIDPAEIGKNRVADVPIVGDCREVITDLLAALRDRGRRRPHRRLRGLGRVPRRGEEDATRSATTSRPTGPGPAVRHRAARRDRRPGRHLRLRRRPAPDVGRAVHRLREAQHLAQLRRPRHHGLLRAGRDGRQGRHARTRTVWAIDGDGCFQMTNQELATCAINDIPIKVAIINNESLGMVRQWQTLFYNERYSNTDLHSQADPGLRQARRGLRLRRAGLRRPGRRRRHDQEGDGDRRRARGRGLPGPPRRDGVADGRRRHQQRRDQVRPRPRPAVRRPGPLKESPHEHAHPERPGGEQARRAGPRSPACSAGAASTSTRWRWARPSTPRSRG